jgi:hypothetical protein
LAEPPDHPRRRGYFTGNKLDVEFADLDRDDEWEVRRQPELGAFCVELEGADVEPAELCIVLYLHGDGVSDNELADRRS